MFGSDVTGESLPEAYGWSRDQALQNDLVSMQLLRQPAP